MITLIMIFLGFICPEEKAPTGANKVLRNKGVFATMQNEKIN